MGEQGLDGMDGLLRADAVAGLLGCSVKAVYRLATEQQIAHHRVGRLVRFRRADVEEFLARCRIEVA